MQIPATIQAGESLAPAVDLGSHASLVGIVLDDAWEGDVCTFQASLDGQEFFDLLDDVGDEVALAVEPGTAVAFGQDIKSEFTRWRYFRVRSGTSGAPVNQTAPTTVTFAGFGT